MTIIDWDETMLRQVRPEAPKPSDPEMTPRDVDLVVENGRLRRMLGREGRPGGRTYDEENPAWGGGKVIPQKAKLEAVKAYAAIDGQCRPVAMSAALEAALPHLSTEVESVKVTDEAVEAMLTSWFGTGYQGNHMKEGRAALEAALPHLSQGEVSHESPPWLSDIAMKIAIEMESQSALSTTTVEKAEAICDILSALSPAPVGVATKDAELVATLRQYADYRTTADDMSKAMYLAADRLEALASHEPAPVGVTDEEMLVAAFLRGESWRKRNDVDRYAAAPEMVEKAARDYADATLSALASHEPAPTDTQEGLSEAGEVAAYAEVLSGKVTAVRVDKSRHCTVPLVRQSALTACQQEVERLTRKYDELLEGFREHGRGWKAATQRADAAEKEVERLREEKRDAYHDGYASRDGVVNACRKRAETAEARNLELEADLEIANDKMHRLARVLREARGLLISLDGGRYIHNSRFPGKRIDGDLWDQVSRVAGKARAALGGQSNG